MSQLSEEDRAELVAYLDGELDEEASQAFEARMTRDRQLRAEAEALKKTWELLDFLPCAEPSTGFTHRTMERLAVGDTGRMTAGSLRGRWNWLAPAGWVAAMFLAVLGSLWAGQILWPVASPLPPVQQPPDLEALMIPDLDVIRNKRLYDNAEDLAFLRSLSKAFDDEDD